MMISCGAKNKQEILSNNFFPQLNWEKAEVVREWLECWTRYLEVVGNFCKQPAGLPPAHWDFYHYYIPFD